MTLIESLLYLLVVLPLATGAVIDAWYNGSLLAERRALAETRAAAFERGEYSLRNIVAAMLTCTFCMSYHVPVWLLLLQYLPAFTASWLGWYNLARLILLPSYALTGTRLSWICNGLVPDHLRYGYKLNKAHDEAA